MGPIKSNFRSAGVIVSVAAVACLVLAACGGSASSGAHSPSAHGSSAAPAASPTDTAHGTSRSAPAATATAPPLTSATNACDIFTSAETSAVLKHPVASSKLTEPGLCADGAVPVGTKYLYLAQVQIQCGPDPNPSDGYNALAATGSYPVGKASDKVRAISTGGQEFVMLRGCLLSATVALNMRTGTVVAGSAAALTSTMDAVVERG